MAAQLVVKRIIISPFHLQANRCVERFTQTLAQDLAFLLSIGQNDWDLHVALDFFRYDSVVKRATQMTPYRAMFGVEPFLAWSPHEARRIRGNHTVCLRTYGFYKQGYSLQGCASEETREISMDRRLLVHHSGRETASGSGFQTLSDRKGTS